MAPTDKSSAALPNLLATTAYPDLTDRLRLFRQFIGSWDMQVQFFDEQGTTVFDGPGLWEFAWILDGRAIQDTLMYDDAERFPAPVGQRRIGTTIRTYLPSSDSWRQVWTSPRAELFIVMEAHATDQGIRITGADMDGSWLEWSFSEITPHVFTWTGRTSQDGERWRVEQLMTAQRRS